jgi:SPX domain protein involved in polyphosphate accumulation
LFDARSEEVFFLETEREQAFINGVAARLNADWFHRSEAEDGEPLAHYITTLYFDSDTHALARACESGHGDIRLRAREYCDQLTEQRIRREPLLGLVVMTRIGPSTRKIRFSIPSNDVPTALGDGVISERLAFQSQTRAWGQPAESVLHEIAQLSVHTGPLRPDCMSHYRRRAWKDTSESLRITLDTDLAFFRPPSHLPWSDTTLADAITKPPVGQLRDSLVEIKARGEQPAWLCELMVEVGLAPAREGERVFSKFVAASHAVHLARDSGA